MFKFPVELLNLKTSLDKGFNSLDLDSMSRLKLAQYHRLQFSTTNNFYYNPALHFWPTIVATEDK